MEHLVTQWILALAAFLVVLGMGLLLAAYYMGRQAQRALSLMENLLRLASRHEDDPLAFVPSSLDVLRLAGLGYGQVVLNWFGEKRLFEVGGRPANDDRCITQVLGAGEIEAKVFLCPRGGLRGEKRVLFEMLTQLWLRVLGSQINGRIAQLHLSEQRLRRYELFYKHDLKNLAQFMRLLGSQLQRCERERDAMMLVERLQGMLPALEQRAGRILKHLDHRGGDGWEGVELVSLGERIRALAHDLELDVVVEGEAELMAMGVALDQALQGVLENFRHHPGGTPVQVSIHMRGEEVEVVMTGPRMRGGLDSQKRTRMFEPFWTTSESGMGLGLYIARQSIQEACAGTLDARVLDQASGQWGFVMRCPLRLNGRSGDSAPPSQEHPARPPE